GDVENLTVVNCNRGVVSYTEAPFGPYLNTNSQHNSYRNISIQVPSQDAAMGILFTGVTAANTCYSTLENVNIYLPETANYTYGIYLQAADSNVFTNIQVYGGGPNGVSVNFDYTVSGNWPSGNAFLWLDPYQAGGGRSFTSAGSPNVNASLNF